MDLLKLLEEIEGELERSPRIPMTSRVVIEADSFLEYVDKLRGVMPEELRQAQWVTKERERIISEAENEAKEILSRAEEQAKKLADETEIIKEANAKAESIINDAQKRSRDIAEGANEYAFEVLNELEGTLTKAISVVRKGQNELQSKEEQPEEKAE